MGIGAAFATGLIGGLTRNMEREFEKRQTDQQKIDAVQTLLTEYAMKPDDEKSLTGVNAVRAMLTGAQEQVSQRPRVGLLGRRSPELELDIGEMKGIMDEVSAYEFYVGSGDNKIGFNIKRPDKIDAGAGRAIFAEVGRHMGDEKTRLKYLADPNAYNTVNNFIEQSIAAYNAAVMNSPKEEIFLFDESTVSWWNDWQELGDLRRSTDKKPKSVNQMNADSLQQANPDTNIVGVWKSKKVGPDGEPKILIGPISFDGNPNKEALEASYMNIGTLLGAPDPQSAFDSFQENVQIFDINDDDLLQMMEDSIMLGADLPRIGMLAPGKGLKKVVGDANMSAQEKYAQTYEKLSEYNTTGTFENGVYMLYPHFIDRGKSTIFKGANGRTGNYKTAAKMPNSQSYVVEVNYGTEVSQTINFGMMEKELSDNFNVMTDLNTLALTAVELEDSVAYSRLRDALRFAGEAIVSVGKDLGFLDGLGLSEAQRKSISVGADPTRSITSDFLSQLNAQLEEAKARDAAGESAGKDVTFAELMSLRIGLAFKMARAADPSGRLSDQDVRQQLERLGGDFDNVQQIVAKIGIVAKEFEQRYKKLQVLVGYGAGDGRPLTPESKAVIDAAISYDYISRMGQLGDGSNISVGFNSDEIDPLFLTANNEPVFKRYEDDTSVNAYPNEKEGGDQYFTKTVGSNGVVRYKKVRTADLVARSRMETRPNPSVDTAGRPIPENEAPLAGPRMNPTVDTAGRPVDQVPVTGPRMNPSVDTAGRPVEENEFPGLTDEEAEIIRGLRGGQDEEDVTFDPENIPRKGTPRRRIKPRPQRPVDPETDILPGEPGSGTERTTQPPAPELPEAAVSDIDEEEDLEFTPKEGIVLGEGEYSPKTHQMVPGTGSNDTGFEIMTRGSKRKEVGKFRLEGNKYVPVEVM